MNIKKHTRNLKSNHKVTLYIKINWKLINLILNEQLENTVLDEMKKKVWVSYLVR